jgi:hypothetical protein
MIALGGRTTFFFSGCGCSSRMITLRGRVGSFLPERTAMIVSVSSEEFASSTATPSD